MGKKRGKDVVIDWDFVFERVPEFREYLKERRKKSLREDEGLKEVIDEIGPERLIGLLGPKRLIEVIGPEKVIKEMGGMKGLVGVLTPAQRKELKRCLDE